MQVDLMGVAEIVHKLVLNRPLEVSRGSSGWSLVEQHRYHHHYWHTHTHAQVKWWCRTCGFSPQQFCWSRMEGIFPDDSESRRAVDRTHLVQFNQKSEGEFINHIFILFTVLHQTKLHSLFLSGPCVCFCVIYMLFFILPLIKYSDSIDHSILEYFLIYKGRLTENEMKVVSVLFFASPGVVLTHNDLIPVKLL